MKEISENMNMPWIISGDFNIPLNFVDRMGRHVSHNEVDACIQGLCVVLWGV